MERIAIIVLFAFFASVTAQAENFRTLTHYQYTLIPEHSYFEVSGGPGIVLMIGEEPPQRYFSNVTGSVAVTVIDDYFDTLANGESRDPVTFRRIDFQFSELSIPTLFDEGSLYSKQSPLILKGNIITGERLGACDFENALGTRCRPVGVGGAPTQFSGEWSPAIFFGEGITRHAFGGVKFSFSIEANPVPLPSNLVVVGALTTLLLRRRIND